MAATTTMPLDDLGADACEAVTRHLAPQSVARLMHACRALSTAAAPRQPAWTWLRAHIKEAWSWKYVRKEHVCEAAAGAGHLQALVWARAQGCSVGSRAVVGAAKGGHLAVLEWLRTQELKAEQSPTTLSVAEPWGWEARKAAAGGGHLPVLRWLGRHGLTQ